MAKLPMPPPYNTSPSSGCLILYSSSHDSSPVTSSCQTLHDFISSSKQRPSSTSTSTLLVRSFEFCSRLAHPSSLYIENYPIESNRPVHIIFIATSVGFKISTFCIESTNLRRRHCASCQYPCCRAGLARQKWRTISKSKPPSVSSKISTHRFPR